MSGQLVKFTCTFKILKFQFYLFLYLEMEEQPNVIPPPIQRLNSYASSSSSSGVVANIHSKSLSQNLSCDSSRSNFSTFESLELNLSDCSDLAGSLPSCATTTVTDSDPRDEGKRLYNDKFRKSFNLLKNRFSWLQDRHKYIHNASMWLYFRYRHLPLFLCPQLWPRQWSRPQRQKLPWRIPFPR